MAAIYDEQGNYVGDDGTPSLDQMKLELVKKNQPLSAQIPGYDRPIPQAQSKPDPLGAAAGNFTELATKFNPLMMAKSMREAAGIVTVPAVAAVKGVGESILTSPAGTYTSGKAPAYAEQVAKQFMEQNAPQTPMTQEFAGAIAPYMAELPAYLGHLSTGRPALTPNDLRVMGAEATRIGRQVRDIPTDFANAQSGLQKLDPITGQPTYGAKLQGVAENVGDIMAQREMQGLPPIPGLPASMQPMNTKLYAMRPAGSRLTNAAVPKTASPDAATHMPAQDIVNDVIDNPTITPLQAVTEIQDRILQTEATAPAREAFANFLKQKANEMYPDAPTPADALQAYKTLFANKEASAPHTLQMYDEFLQTPEGAQFKAAHNLPTAKEITARHEAASNWLNSQFTNYINEKVGTPDEPAAKLARQGLTFLPPSKVTDAANVSPRLIGAKRVSAGMPALTSTDEALIAAQQQLQELETQALIAKDNKIAQETLAHSLGYGAQGGPNVGQYAPFAEASRIEAKAENAVRKHQQAVNNLRLGSAYETAADLAIHATTAEDLKENLKYKELQFYPSLLKTPGNEKVYTADRLTLQNLGFRNLALKFYNDVMSGAIPLDKVSKTTVENYIRSTAEARIAEEKRMQLEADKYKKQVDAQFKKSAETYIPNDKVFGNVGALEITDAFEPLQIRKLISEDTTALDHCVGEGGSAKNKPNLWHPNTGNRSYEPAYDVATGLRNPNAGSPRQAYANAVEKGDEIVSFRDISTGIPVATFQLEKNRATPGKFNIGFASGLKNGEVKPEYIQGIKSYLNSRSDALNSPGSDLAGNLGIYDLAHADEFNLARATGLTTAEFRNLNLNELPRFVTLADLRNYIADVQARGAQAPAIANQRPSESIEAYLQGGVSSAIDGVLDSLSTQFAEAGESDNFRLAEVFFEGVRNDFNYALATERNPLTAAGNLAQLLYDLESEYANSPRIAANLIAEGIQDLLDDVRGHIDLAFERQRFEAAEAARPRPFAQRAEPAQAQRPDYLRMTHDAALEADRDWGTTTADEVRSEIRNITEQLGIDPANDTDVFIAQLRRAADTVALNSSETILRELADRMESEYMRDWEPEEAAQPREADLANQRNDAMIQLENSLNDPELNPDDLRFLANGLSNPADQTANSPWIALTERERREYALALRERANYIEFSPADFAIRLSNEAGADIADLRDTVQALNDGTFDHEVLRGLPPVERDRAAQRTALNLNHILQGMETDARQQVRAAEPATQPFDFAGMVDAVMGDMSAALPDPVVERVSTIAYRIAERTNPRLDPIGYAQALRAVNAANEHVAVVSALNDLADRITQTQQPANQSVNIVANRPAQQYMRAAEDIANILDESEYGDYATGEVAARQIDRHLRDLQQGGVQAFEDLLGMASLEYNWSPELLRALEIVLSDLATRYRDMGDGEGNADGGPVRGYQAGGSVKKPEVKTPWLFSVPTYSETVAYEMYPGQKGQNDQRDAARHMLAAGTLSRKYGPGVAEFLGKAHEFTTSPLQAVKTLFGGQMPADYGMDTHNNAVGAQLGQRAKSQAELEDLVQAEAERASRTQTPGQAFIKKANGGIVQQNPTTDQMRYALMMRRK